MHKNSVGFVQLVPAADLYLHSVQKKTCKFEQCSSESYVMVGGLDQLDVVLYPLRPNIKDKYDILCILYWSIYDYAVPLFI